MEESKIELTAAKHGFPVAYSITLFDWNGLQLQNVAVALKHVVRYNHKILKQYNELLYHSSFMVMSVIFYKRSLIPSGESFVTVQKNQIMSKWHLKQHHYRSYHLLFKFIWRIGCINVYICIQPIFQEYEIILQDNVTLQILL